MTIKEIAHQLHNISVAGYFNREKFTEERLHNYLNQMLRTGNHLVMEIALPDGRWYFSVSHYSNTHDGYDYCIPDTREQENRIKAMIGIGS